MSCETNRELLEQYGLGILDDEELAEVNAHVRDRCSTCAANFRSAYALNAVVLGSLPLVEPPALLRSRILNMVRLRMPARSRMPIAWIAIAAGLAFAMVWFGLDNQTKSNEIAVARLQMRQMQERSDELNRALTFLRDPETRPASMKPDANKPRGTYFVNPRAGVMLIASNLPTLTPGRVYEMWVIPKGQSPRPAGVFRPDSSGSAVHLQTGPVDIANTAAFAITEEPEAGSNAPTTTPFLVMPAQGL